MKFELRPPDQRSRAGLAVSVVAHVAIGALLLRAVIGSTGIAEWLIGPAGQLVAEAVQMVAVTPPRGDQSGGRAPVEAMRPPRPQPGAAALVAPTSVPTSIPAASDGSGGSGGGTGTGIGRGNGSGISRGVVPGYDPRLYPGAPEAPRITRTPKERLDSLIADRFAEYADSVANLPQTGVTQDGQADLTFRRGGKTYGWTRKGIVLGNITLPAPLLALLPLNRIGGNPSALMRGEFPVEMRNQIQAGAQIALNAETFNDRVKRIRERRDRERKDAREGRDPQLAPASQPIAPLPTSQTPLP